jgi:ABC-type polysaccharide/polyol phosphate export permease
VAVYVDLVRYRELFVNLFRRDFQAKYRGSVLGIVWSLVNPVALMAVYLVVFGLLWQGSDIPRYPLYLLAGLTCWIFFATSLQTGARSLVESADLV